MSSRWLTNEDETAPTPVNLNHLVRNATYDAANHKIVLQKHDNITMVDVDITTLGAHDTSLTNHATDIGNLQSTATTQGNTLSNHTSTLATHGTNIGTLQSTATAQGLNITGLTNDRCRAALPPVDLLSTALRLERVGYVANARAGTRRRLN